jgi:hypothetical protein
MKSIINGKRYDTEKAVFIGRAYHGNAGDFNGWDASLYRTPRSGRYFLDGHGGPMTRWARSVDRHTFSGGSGIIPIDNDEALTWAEHNLSVELVEKHFGKRIEDA